MKGAEGKRGRMDGKADCASEQQGTRHPGPSSFCGSQNTWKKSRATFQTMLSGQLIIPDCQTQQTQKEVNFLLLLFLLVFFRQVSRTLALPPFVFPCKCLQTDEYEIE